MEHEHIVATGIYYFEQQNISASSLQFEIVAEYIADCKPLGEIPTFENQCIVFPNTVRHAPSSFHLQHGTKNGYRKLLVFFLIDPYKEIIATDRVPPQQPEWFIETLQNYQCFGRKFPYDVLPLIVSFMTPFYHKQVVKQFRDELTLERKKVQEDTAPKQFDLNYYRPYLCD